MPRVRPYLEYGLGVGFRIRPYRGYGIDTLIHKRPYGGYDVNVTLCVRDSIVLFNNLSDSTSMLRMRMNVVAP